MNFYTAAVKLQKAINRTAAMNELVGLSTEEAREKAKEMELKTFRANISLGIDMMLIYKEVAIEKGLIKPDDRIKNTYFITIRPDDRIIDIHDFYALVEKFVTRKFFKSFTLTFEQKGTTVEDYGKGFHAHIIAEIVPGTKRSKSEVLRDTQSTFKCCTSANCIEVVPLKTQKDYDNCESYMIEYTSDDGHKEITKEHDPIWRETLGIKPFYKEDDVDQYKRLPSIKSNVGQAIRSSTGTYIVDLAN